MRRGAGGCSPCLATMFHASGFCEVVKGQQSLTAVLDNRTASALLIFRVLVEWGLSGSGGGRTKMMDENDTQKLLCEKST